MTNFAFYFYKEQIVPIFFRRTLNIPYFCKQYMWQPVRQLMSNHKSKIGKTTGWSKILKERINCLGLIL